MMQRLLLVITILAVARLATFVVLGDSSSSQRPLPSVASRSPAAIAPPPPTQSTTPFNRPPQNSTPLGDESDWQELEPFEMPVAQALTPEGGDDPDIWGQGSDRRPGNESDGQKPMPPADPWSQVPERPRSPQRRPNHSPEPWDLPASPLPPGDQRIAGACDAIKSAVVTVRVGRDVGSGSIVRSQGLILTNYHVIRRSLDQQVRIQTQTGQSYLGQVIARDRPNDLALIQLDHTELGNTQPLPTVRLSTTAPPTGQSVCAIGSPFGAAGTITTGRLVRILDNGDLQSDVELHPGNSGGPLVNAQGEMIGVNKGVARSRRRSPRAQQDGEQNQNTPPRRSYATNASIAEAFIQQHAVRQRF